MALVLLLGLCSSALLPIRAGWVDPETPEENLRTSGFNDGLMYDLIMSDEFNKEGREFGDGHDPRWTAMEKNDYTNAALQYYSSKAVRTHKGKLRIQTTNEDVTYKHYDDKTKRQVKGHKYYVSGMVQGWNKFCFTGGIIEVSAQLPGEAYVGGLWPAVWLMGNLARATYTASSDFMWPWSYEKCDRSTEESSNWQFQQEVSSCDKSVHYDFHPLQGRGAAEIDILEAMMGEPPDHKLLRLSANNSSDSSSDSSSNSSSISSSTSSSTSSSISSSNSSSDSSSDSSDSQKRVNIGVPYVSSSLQIAPGRAEGRPIEGELPEPGKWYEEDITYGTNTSLNTYFYGSHLLHKPDVTSYWADAISANHALGPEHFDSQHIYRVEWQPGKKGYIRWYLDGAFVFGLTQETLSAHSPGSIIPVEPMYILFNTAMSITWGFPQPCPVTCPCDCWDARNPHCTCAVPPGLADIFPANFEVDWVRVYQNRDDPTHSKGCNPPNRPTDKWIRAHAQHYKDPADTEVMRAVPQGGGPCKHDSDCGQLPSSDALAHLYGHCEALLKRCRCNVGFTGPHCLAHAAFSEKKDSVKVHRLVPKLEQPLVPCFLAVTLVALLGAFCLTVYTRWEHRKQRSLWAHVIEAPARGGVPVAAVVPRGGSSPKRWQRYPWG